VHRLGRLDRRQRDAVVQDLCGADRGVARRSAAAALGRAAVCAVSPATGSTAFARALRVGSGSNAGAAAVAAPAREPPEPPEEASAAATTTVTRTTGPALSRRRRRTTACSMPMRRRS
jgi:hypothetical protein